VRVVNGEIVSFRTFMTGEVFAALSQHTILSRLMVENGIPTGKGFAEGVTASAAVRQGGDLLSALFATRTLGLFERLETYELRGYLSGLLIGTELRANLTAEPITLIAANTLADPYIAAADLLGLPVRRAPADAAIIGLAHLARAAGWLAPSARKNP
jgi:2-dehydro-3-deoxygalactonokinase